MSLRERKKAETWGAIHAAAATAVLERGLAAVTIEQIAADVGISPRTFFNYFPSKDHAVLGLREPHMDDCALEGLEPGPGLLKNVAGLLGQVLKSSTPSRNPALRLEVLKGHRELIGLHKHYLSVSEDMVRSALLDHLEQSREQTKIPEDPDHPVEERVRLLVMVAGSILRFVWTDPLREPGTEPTGADITRAVETYEFLNRTDLA